MIGKIVHVGVTVSNLEKSIDFYSRILGLELVDRMVMEGESTDVLFGGKNLKVYLAYLNGSDNLECPPVELICFSKSDRKSEPCKSDIFRPSISEICFITDDIDKEYERLGKLGVEFLSEPQTFNLGGVKSRAVYFRDPDGTILELSESI